jgi:hypothetical protein
MPNKSINIKIKTDHFTIGEEWASDEHKSCYIENVKLGRDICKNSKVAVLSLARNCEKNLQKSIDQITKLQSSDFKFFIYENDSVDLTKEILSENKSPKISISLNTDRQPFLNDRSRRRTNNLAEYRNKCLEWAKQECSNFDYALVLDLDADAGFSIDGIYNSISWLQKIEKSAGMGSHSLCYNNNEFTHYDTFAIRIKSFVGSSKHTNNGERGFINYHPHVGSKPFALYSCFGGLAVYKMQCFLKGNYDGSMGCEHILFHKSLRDHGYGMYLNPSSIFFTVLNQD